MTTIIAAYDKKHKRFMAGDFTEEGVRVINAGEYFIGISGSSDAYRALLRAVPVKGFRDMAEVINAVQMLPVTALFSTIIISSDSFGEGIVVLTADRVPAERGDVVSVIGHRAEYLEGAIDQLIVIEQWHPSVELLDSLLERVKPSPPKRHVLQG